MNSVRERMANIRNYYPGEGRLLEHRKVVHMTTEEYERLKEVAERHRVSMNAVIRLGMNELFNSLEMESQSLVEGIDR